MRAAGSHGADHAPGCGARAAFKLCGPKACNGAVGERPLAELRSENGRACFVPGATTGDYENDIPLDLAREAHAGSSFVPERRAEQEREMYANTLRQDYASLARYADTPEKRAALDREFARYRAGLREKTVAKLAADSRTVSSMITGPSNFPTARNQKRLDSAHKRLEELMAFRERAMTAIRRELTPADQPIRRGDADAVPRLDAKLEALKAEQARMVAANAAIRRHAKAGAEAQTAALVALGISPGAARQLLVPDYMGRAGFADYQIKNNAANIRRIEARSEVVAAVQAQPDREIEGAGGVSYVVSPSENRVRITFPGKPDAATIAQLKASGFRWAPSQGAWSGYVNTRTQDLARRLAGG